MVKVLFVCTGNICRSPTAHGVFRALVAREGLGAAIQVDSAGTHAYHVGEPPDRRSMEAAKRRGVDLSDLRARQVVKADYDRFDLLLAMDRGHFGLLLGKCPPVRQDALALFLSFAPQLNILDVPDPYYGPGDGFERVLDMIEAGSVGLLQHIRETLL
ncbi:phosphotyrosine protein phosphatase [Paramagnetospirillum kuznetsovii]|uniref:protein-tyrosine-phosphatase n=1 Tax=Paramagnetospirillum kuznetsovii TaxID=2053833 RepID=A0A364P2E5_9PROT|nr:low molecular weight protein-tyrosine-phosphatase [Paramagnetospirillum kuznetsovii]RAU23504.1 phosphotyrosine protein phosphatase [Paramagnetospirillum kuznetsovii]